MTRYKRRRLAEAKDDDALAKVGRVMQSKACACYSSVSLRFLAASGIVKRR
jgi:hypothetical protein